MRAVILSGGRVSDYTYIKNLIQKDDTIICADSGYNHAVEMGLWPHIIVGDFDSINKIPTGIPILRFPEKKDFTDTELAIDYARDMGFKNFLLLGCIGTRMDHSITNILLLKGFVERNENAIIQNEHNKIMLTSSTLCLNEDVGGIVSLIPLQTCSGVCTLGLEYQLRDAVLHVGKGIGISNIITGCASISINDGLLLVIVARD